MKARSPTCWITSKNLVVKETRGSGGYGMLVGPHATKKTRDAFAKKLAPKPISLRRSTDARALDLPDLRRLTARRRATSTCARSFCPGADGMRIVPGGLTRVALRTVRSSSIQAKAAARKTLGCCTHVSGGAQ